MDSHVTRSAQTVSLLQERQCTVPCMLTETLAFTVIASAEEAHEKKRVLHLLSSFSSGSHSQSLSTKRKTYFYNCIKHSSYCNGQRIKKLQQVL